MKFSILHATARLPMGWVDSWRDWSNKMSKNSPHEVEYILCVHADDYGKLPFEFLREEEQRPTGIKITFIGRKGRVCANASWNAAARVSTGDLLILNADDLFPCQNWDEHLISSVPPVGHGTYSQTSKSCQDIPFILHISTGSPRDHELISHPVMSRALYDKLGYIFYPEYESMYGDDDLTEMAVKMGVVADARHIQFEHRNPLFTGEARDAVWQYTNRDEAYQSGRDILARRRAENFGLGANAPVQAQYSSITHTGKSIAILTPGEVFSMEWVQNWTKLLSHIQSRFRTGSMFGHASNVYIIRASMWEAIRNEHHDLILWMDDDNILEPAQFDLLVADLDAHPELDGVVGWCWANQNKGEYAVSCGNFAPGGLPLNIPFSHSELMKGPEDLVAIDWSGFPVVLLRGRVMQQAGHLPFTPILVPNVSWGMTGEDVSFFFNAATRGHARFACDRRVQVPHLKLRPVAPSIPALIEPLSPNHGAQVITRAEPNAASVLNADYAMGLESNRKE